jgi:hypothetical protein
MAARVWRDGRMFIELAVRGLAQLSVWPEDVTPIGSSKAVSSARRFGCGSSLLELSCLSRVSNASVVVLVKYSDRNAGPIANQTPINPILTRIPLHLARVAPTVAKATSKTSLVDTSA